MRWGVGYMRWAVGYVRWAARAVVVAARALAGLVWPVDCAGCGMEDVALCFRCERALSGEPFLADIGLESGHPIPVWGLAGYGGIPAAVIVAWKKHGRHDLTRTLGAHLGAAVTRCVAQARLTGRLRGEGRGEVWLVPMPARAAALRERGADLPFDLARWAARADADLRAVRVLRHVRRVRDQVGLGHRQRRQNLRGAFGVRPRRVAALAGRKCIVVDDIVTTGASVTEAVRVLTHAGAQVVGVCCLSVTFRQRGVPAGPERTSLRAWKAPSR